ncbi:hypothetical protein TNCV_962141 [Trichonephila clavipes]|nr:hypothetical protein TNCV_962141 [Trichonephila clavipes]
MATEIIKNCKVKEKRIPRSQIETTTTSEQFIMTNVKSTISVVQSIAIYRICHALELNTGLAASNDTNPEAILTPRQKSTSILKEKGLKTIAKYLQHDFVFAYTNGSSDETFLNGGSGVFMTTPSDAHYQRVVGAGAIASLVNSGR